MKLRFRSLDSKETLEVEVPNGCRILELKEILSSRISNGDSSLSIHPEQLFLTLNRKDELSGSYLLSAGVTSGDLIFYSLNPTPRKLSNVNAPCAESKNMADYCSLELLPSRKRKANVLEGHKIAGGEVEGVEGKEVDEDDGAYLRSLSVPSFLKKVFENEIGHYSTSNGSDNMLLKVAVHAVLLESGFVAYDPASRDGFLLLEGSPALPSSYTITQVLSSQSVPCVAIKFQEWGRFININGSLTSRFIYRLFLDASHFAPAFRSIWESEDAEPKENSVKNNPDSDVFEFWNLVKDRIALPLLIDICESVGIAPPSSLMTLPTDLKLKILELVHGTDVANVACTCAELRFISSNIAVRRQKYEDRLEMLLTWALNAHASSNFQGIGPLGTF